MRKHNKIFRIWTAYHPDDTETEGHEQWCRAKLLLHHPHRDVASLKAPDGTWAEAYLVCQADHPEGHIDSLPNRNTGNQRHNEAPDSSSEFSDYEEVDNRELDDLHLMWREGGIE